MIAESSTMIALLTPTWLSIHRNSALDIGYEFLWPSWLLLSHPVLRPLLSL